jgi:hypothetical protein
VSTFSELARSLEDISVPALDVEALVAQGERRVRRRRVAAMAASATVVGLIIAGGFVAGSVRQESSAPFNRPDQSTTPTDLPSSSASAIRPLVYSEGRPDNNPVEYAPSGVRALRVGARKVRIDQVIDLVRAWSTVVTDAGAVYVQHDHSIWFTDGGAPRRIATQACAGSAGDWVGLASGNSSPLVAWLDCAPRSFRDLVVHDTSRGHEVGRYRIPACVVRPFPDGIPGCTPEAIIGDHLYIGTVDHKGWLTEHALSLDLTTGKVGRAGEAVFARDLMTGPRALVVGESWGAGTAADRVDFRAEGRRLTPGTRTPEGSRFRATRAFDTATGRPLRLRLPVGYHPGADNPDLAPDRTFTLFEWLGDDAIALNHHDDDGTDILTCYLADGRCIVDIENQEDVLTPMTPGRGGWNIPG